MPYSYSKSLGMALSFAALAIVGASAQPADRSNDLQTVSVVELQAINLECDRIASTSLLDFQTAVACSMAWEELLKRGFGGSFERLLEWWRSNRKNCTKDTDCIPS